MGSIIRLQGRWLWILSPQEIADVEATTLADVIRRNTSIGSEISDDVFHIN